MVLCLQAVHYGRLSSALLGQLGDKSMDMWMIHTWFSSYLFHDFIYGFRYPVLIFVVLAIVSYLSATVVEWLIRPVERLIFTRRQMRQKPMI